MQTAKKATKQKMMRPTVVRGTMSPYLRGARAPLFMGTTGDGSEAPHPIVVIVTTPQYIAIGMLSNVRKPKFLFARLNGRPPSATYMALKGEFVL